MRDFALPPAATFLGLPQELRDHTYSYLPLETKKLIYLGPVSSKPKPRAWRTYKRLSRVCRIIRVDVSRIFWAKNAFVMNAGPETSRLTADTMFWMTRLALRTAPYYFQPPAVRTTCEFRYEGILLLNKRGNEWKAMIDLEKQRMLQSLIGGYRVTIDLDPDFGSPEGVIELETQRRIVDDVMQIGEEAVGMLENDGQISEDVLAGICGCFKRYSDHYASRLCRLNCLQIINIQPQASSIPSSKPLAKFYILQSSPSWHRGSPGSSSSLANAALLPLSSVQVGSVMATSYCHVAWQAAFRATFLLINRELICKYQVHNPEWASEDVCFQRGDIEKMVFDETKPGDNVGVREEYHSAVILADERRFLKNEALKHGRSVAPGSVKGERIEFIVNGQPVVADPSWREWRDLWQTYVNKHDGASTSPESSNSVRLYQAWYPKSASFSTTAQDLTPYSAFSLISILVLATLLGEDIAYCYRFARADGDFFHLENLYLRRDRLWALYALKAVRWSMGTGQSYLHSAAPHISSDL
ncbi:uncharacterized protein MYCFIDRAFT_179249 [Pseudocercospora fijiensis CIRAD86]|uniref:Uncharacterized protein n=1 Tax=Pseudocercospora fijiensis (strain CIRAD86) TaxID=383855 RepID=M3A041_PSEFD|nr:uncharacterized protein MYCFIDRAFT_179249 [Pseudocercospora fijiensis CIRAD86]EME77756.1 hypothetical protein MYCFIDRAFT_179249 [Pseudocercospora fijiensis CIRAD86]